MKQFLSLIAIAIFSVSASAQQPKIIVDSIDDFTGQRQQLTSDFQAGPGLEMSVGKVQDQLLMFVHTDQGCVGAVGNQVIFLYDDGKTETLQDMTSRVVCSGTRFITLYLPKQAAQKPIVKMRITTTDGTQDFSVNAEIVLQAFRLLK